MATHTTVQLADAVVAMLNATNLSMEFTAVRSYTPDYAIPELETLRVTVVPSDRADAPLDRTRREFTHTLLIGIQQKLDPTTDRDEQVDALMGFVDQIADVVRRFSPQGEPQAQWLKTTAKPIYAPDHLSELGTFTAVLSVDYRTWS